MSGSIFKNRSVTLLLALLLLTQMQGCIIYSQKEIMWLPTAVDFVPVKDNGYFYQDQCRGNPDALVVPLVDGVLVRLQRFNSGDKGAYVSAEFYLPPAVTIRFSDDSIVVVDGSGGSYIGNIKSYNNEVQSLTSLPVISKQGAVSNDYSIKAVDVTTQSQVSAGDITLRLQNIDINGQTVKAKSILYKRMEREVTYNSLCS